jgi:predicted DsbA family dithiol-disulfide isomerase
VAGASVALAQQARPPARKQADPAVTYAVPLDDSPSDGPAHAKVTIVMGLDFDCPFCERAWGTLGELRTEYGKDLRIVFKSFIVHEKDGTEAALAACAAHRQGKWRLLADVLWTQAFDKRDFSEAHLVSIARAVGLDGGVLVADMHGTACKLEVLRDQTELGRLGQNGTPTFWVNGRFVMGAQPKEIFEKLIDEEKQKAEAVMKAGVTLDDYYDTLLKNGRREL